MSLATPEQMGYYLGGGYLNYPVGSHMDSNGSISVPTKVNLGNSSVPPVNSLHSSVSANTLGSVNPQDLGGLASSLFGALRNNSLIGAGITGGLGLANTLFNSLFGYGMQKEQWRREDTAYQRKVADLKAAGLNPILAVGGAGSPTTLASTSSYAPNVADIPAQSIGMYSNVLMLQRQAIENMLLSKDLDYKDAEQVRKWVSTIFGIFK